MSKLIYAEALPTNQKSSYGEFDTVDFNLSFPNRKLAVGSVRLEGELEVKYDGRFLNSTDSVDGTTVNGKMIYLDHMNGMHSLCEQITTRAGGKVLETLSEYPRYAKMSLSATSTRNDCLNSDRACELATAFDMLSLCNLQGVVPATQSATEPQRLNPDFSVRPFMCLNSGSSNLSYKKSGDIEVSFTLNRVFGLLFGNDVNSKVSYVVRNLRLRYITVPEDDDDEPVILKTKRFVGSSINSSFANIQTRVPAICTAVSISAQISANENTGVHNNVELNKIPALERTVFMFNDNTAGAIVSYTLKNNSEVIGRGIDSLLDTGRNALSPQNLAENDGWIAGLAFDSATDLSQEKFSVQFTSGVTNSVPLRIYMYFHSFVEL
jgi:hypothetical protein